MPVILACHEAGITVTLPKPLTSGAKSDGRFKSFVGSDCRGASIGDCFWCRVRRCPSWAAFSFERGAPAIALNVHFDDGGVVNEAIDGGERHGGTSHLMVAAWIIGISNDMRPAERAGYRLTTALVFTVSIAAHSIGAICRRLQLRLHGAFLP